VKGVVVVPREVEYLLNLRDRKERASVFAFEFKVFVDVINNGLSMKSEATSFEALIGAFHWLQSTRFFRRHLDITTLLFGGNMSGKGGYSTQLSLFVPELRERVLSNNSTIVTIWNLQSKIDS